MRIKRSADYDLKFIERRLNEGATITEIAREYGVARTTLKTWLFNNCTKRVVIILDPINIAARPIKHEISI